MPRIEPDRAALEIAHRRLRCSLSLDQVLADARLRTVLMTVARKHMRSRSRFDPKMLQANDND
jgi:hypothetical protein